MGQHFSPFVSPMSGVAGGNPSSRQAWQVKQTSARVALTMIAVPSVYYGIVPRVASVYGSTASARLIVSYVRKPFLTIAANNAKSGIVRSAARAGLGVSKAYGIAMVASRITNPFMSIKYAMRGDLKRAALAHYGPLGAVWVYNQHEQRMERTDREAFRSVSQSGRLNVKGHLTRTTSSGSNSKIKKKKMSQKQKNRLWRMGLRWCPKHKRYDKCSLRAR